MLLVPVTVNPADWLTAPLLDVAAKFPPTVPCPRFSAPVEITVKFPAAILSVPSVSALASVTATALAPVFVKLTAPIKLLAVSVNVMPNAPVVKLAVVALDPCTMPPAA